VARVKLAMGGAPSTPVEFLRRSAKAMLQVWPERATKRASHHTCTSLLITRG
jgi:hypothetical protein